MSSKRGEPAEHKIVQREARKDGSTRKAIRVRAGYTPQEEVPKYKPRSMRLRDEARAKEQQASKSGPRITEKPTYQTKKPTSQPQTKIEEKPKQTEIEAAHTPETSTNVDEKVKNLLNTVERLTEFLMNLKNETGNNEANLRGDRGTTTTQLDEAQRKINEAMEALKSMSL